MTIKEMFLTILTKLASIDEKLEAQNKEEVSRLFLFRKGQFLLVRLKKENFYSGLGLYESMNCAICVKEVKDESIQFYRENRSGDCYWVLKKDLIVDDVLN